MIERTLYVYIGEYAGKASHYAAGEDLRIRVPDENPNTYDLLLPCLPKGYWRNLS